MRPAVKVYNDGSHYIAVVKRLYKKRKRAKRPEEKFPVTVTGSEIKPLEKDVEEKSKTGKDVNYLADIGIINEPEEREKSADKSIIKQNAPIELMTRKEIFDKVYDENKELKRQDLSSKLKTVMKDYFDSDEYTEAFIKENVHRKRRNIAYRKKRARKKACLANFNYFCTFTYDDKKVTEEEFRRKLSKCLSNFQSRKGWKYMGVWERGKGMNRLHFHALAHIPEGQMVGEFETVKDYNTSTCRMQTQTVNTFFTNKFGRTTFDPIEPHEMDSSLKYILKYIEKTGEKIVYSRGLFMYFVSDIDENEIVMQMTNPRTDVTADKFILADDFTCYDDGEILGPVSPQVIQRLRHSN